MTAILEEEELGPGGKSLADYSTYEDFLDSFVAPLDRAFLGDVHLCRRIVELGYRGSRGGYSREKFDAIRHRIEERKRAALAMQKIVLSVGQKYECPTLRALQQREESNRTGKLATIIYIRTQNRQGQEISGYVDYSHRLTTEDFTPIFNETKRIMPVESDLSFYNWETTIRKGRNSPNYEIIPTKGWMMMRNRRDGKMLNLDPKAPTVGENSSRTVVENDVYFSMIMFDHYNRRRV